MAYEKLGFVSGQTLKAEHLNHIEDGIANAGGGSAGGDCGVLGVVFDYIWDGENRTTGCNRTYQELYDALMGKKIILFVVNYGSSLDYNHIYEGAIFESKEETGMDKDRIVFAGGMFCIYSDGEASANME